jgi:hypothetical protein
VLCAHVHQIVALWRALFQSARIDADLADEMRFRGERETEANILRGMFQEAARRAARLAFGSVDAAQEWSSEDVAGIVVSATIVAPSGNAFETLRAASQMDVALPRMALTPSTLIPQRSVIRPSTTSVSSRTRSEHGFRRLCAND